MNKPLTLEQFQEIYSTVPRLNVELIIKTEQGVLLTKRSIEPWKGSWHVPGGTVYFGETLEDAIHRIASTELGRRVHSIKQVGYIEYPSAKNLNVFVGWPVGIAFSVELTEGQNKVNDEADESGYFKQLPENLIPEQRDILTRALKNEF